MTELTDPLNGITIAHYIDQVNAWPRAGRHIMAQFDDSTIIVYQAYRPSIARYAVEHQRFGGDFSYNRMSWIKPNFLWMMYRAGWATKEGQEHILAVRIRRSLFDDLLFSAVASTYHAGRYASHGEWQAAVATSDVRLQWDPDHDPAGRALERRAVQLGLRGNQLRRYGERDVVSITDVTAFVAEQRQHVPEALHFLKMPKERVYEPANPEAAHAVGIDLCQVT